ncbi:serine hydrolase [bacterium]|nr:serine hydrolase [bacterium]
MQNRHSITPILILVGIITLFVCLNTCSDSDNDSTAEPSGLIATLTPTPVPTVTPTIPTELDLFIEKNMVRAHLPGLAAGIVKGDHLVWTQGYGWAQIESAIPVTPDTLFLLASVSKTIALTSIMQLWERNCFEMDQNINDFLEFSVSNPHFPDDKITFHQLLTHTSSIRDNWAVLLSLYYYHGDSPISLETLMEEYFSEGGDYYDQSENFFAFRPGTHHYYCNQAVALSSYLVELLCGQDFAEFNRQYALEPLGMMHSSWHIEGLDMNQVAMPYRYYEDTGFKPYGWYTHPEYPVCGLRSSVNELAHFLIMYLNNGYYEGRSILNQDTIEYILLPQIPDINATQAMIWFSSQSNGQTYYGHGGGDDGVKTRIGIRPADSSGVILLANGDLTTSDAGSAFSEIFNRLFVEATKY